jgi:GT2 family glycosyltransferase
MPDVPSEVQRLADERAVARAAHDFARADAIRDELTAAGWTVVDAPDSTSVLESIAGPGDALDRAPAVDVSLHWVCEGWPEDVDRAIAGFRERHAGQRLQLVVADVTGQPEDRWGSDVEVVPVPPDAGWAAARNAGLDRSFGEIVVALDPSVEPTGDVLTPLLAALDDAEVGVVGPYGIVTRDLREFEAAPGPGLCDAIEGYLMAFRREVLLEVGGFDEHFRWYRSADIEWSFRIKDAGYRVEVVDVPVSKHEHRMWASTPPEDRATLSKRNFYRFLDRFRDRWDLVEAGAPVD